MQYVVEVTLNAEGDLQVSGNVGDASAAIRMMYLAIVNMLEAEGMDLEDYVVQQEAGHEAVVVH